MVYVSFNWRYDGHITHNAIHMNYNVCIPAVQAPIGLNSSVNLNSNQFYFIGSTMDNNSRQRMIYFQTTNEEKSTTCQLWKYAKTIAINVLCI